jgi:hypothetical protein
MVLPEAEISPAAVFGGMYVLDGNREESKETQVYMGVQL